MCLQNVQKLENNETIYKCGKDVEAEQGKDDISHGPYMQGYSKLPINTYPCM